MGDMTFEAKVAAWCFAAIAAIVLLSLGLRFIGGPELVDVGGRLILAGGVGAAVAWRLARRRPCPGCLRLAAANAGMVQRVRDLAGWKFQREAEDRTRRLYPQLEGHGPGEAQLEAVRDVTVREQAKRIRELEQSLDLVEEIRAAQRGRISRLDEELEAVKRDRDGVLRREAQVTHRCVQLDQVARTFFHADGREELCLTVEEVVERRKAAARELENERGTREALDRRVLELQEKARRALEVLAEIRTLVERALPGVDLAPYTLTGAVALLGDRLELVTAGRNELGRQVAQLLGRIRAAEALAGSPAPVLDASGRPCCPITPAAGLVENCMDANPEKRTESYDRNRSKPCAKAAECARTLGELRQLGEVQELEDAHLEEKPE